MLYTDCAGSSTSASDDLQAAKADMIGDEFGVAQGTRTNGLKQLLQLLTTDSATRLRLPTEMKSKRLRSLKEIEMRC